MVETETVVFGESKYTMEIPNGWVHADYEDPEFLAAFAAGRETLADFLSDEAAIDRILAVPPDKFKENAGVAFCIEPYSLDEDVPLRVLVFYANAANILKFTEYVQGEVRRLRVTWGSEKVEAQRLDEDADCENYEVIYAFKYGDTETASIRYYLKFENEFILLQFTAQKGVYQNLGLDYFRKIARSVQYVGE
jgi:hypothetical protein